MQVDESGIGKRGRTANRLARIEDIGVEGSPSCPRGCHVPVTVISAKVVVRILELDLRGKGSGSGGKSADGTLVAVAHRTEEGRTELVGGGRGLETECSERVEGRDVGYHWRHGLVLGILAMESAQSGIVLAIASRRRHVVGVGIVEVGSCGRRSG